MIEIIKVAEVSYQYNSISNVCCDCAKADADNCGFGER